jgi:hypothetical protein
MPSLQLFAPSIEEVVQTEIEYISFSKASQDVNNKKKEKYFKYFLISFYFIFLV